MIKLNILEVKLIGGAQPPGWLRNRLEGADFVLFRPERQSTVSLGGATAAICTADRSAVLIPRFTGEMVGYPRFSTYPTLPNLCGPNVCSGYAIREGITEGCFKK
jgi:hypothetical protein